MSFIPYIVTSILLSGIGWAVYLLFRWFHPSPKGRRGMAWLVMLSSLTLPLTPGFDLHFGTHPRTAHLVTHDAAGVIPPAGQTLNEFCHCSEPMTGDVIMYQASRIYDTLLAHSNWILMVMLGISGLLLLRQGLRIWRLVRWVRRFPVEKMDLQGKKVNLVRGPHAAGALRLGGRFIFWHNELDQLDEAGKRAVLMHEFSHLKQHNTFEKLLLSALHGIWFLNPVLYFFRRELELLSEYTADAYAAQHASSRKHYATVLLTVKSRPEFAMGHFFKGSSLRRRIEFLLGKSQRPRLAMLPATLIGLALLFSSDLIAQSVIRQQIQEIAVYEYMHERNVETGQEEFCYKCTMEAVECE